MKMRSVFDDHSWRAIVMESVVSKANTRVDALLMPDEEHEKSPSRCSKLSTNT
jgi:hypothetical protein